MRLVCDVKRSATVKSLKVRSSPHIHTRCTALSMMPPDDPRWVLASEPRLGTRAMKLGAHTEGVPYACGTDAMPVGSMRARWLDQEWMAWISAQMCARDVNTLNGDVPPFARASSSQKAEHSHALLAVRRVHRYAQLLQAMSGSREQVPPVRARTVVRK